MIFQAIQIDKNHSKIYFKVIFKFFIIKYNNKLHKIYNLFKY